MRFETRARIQAYQRYLPAMKERVVGAILMIVISLVMVASTTYAWVTLSSSPEASNIDLTLSANGNLEIALATGRGEELPTSGRGDSSARDNNVVRANITWGNLINLSDPAYGIHNIALRPALLNVNNLRTSPLWGAAYGSDGRITGLSTDYTFAEWNGVEFLATQNKGVRAIAAYKLGVSEASTLELQNSINRYKSRVMNAIGDVGVQYHDVALSNSNMNGLKGLLSAYVSGAAKDKLNDTTGTAENTDISDYLPKIYSLYDELYTAMVMQTNVYVEIANYQRYMNSLETGNTFSQLVWEDLKAGKVKYDAATTTNRDAVVHLRDLQTFISDMTQAERDLASLRDIYEDNRDNGTRYVYSQISPIVNRLAGTSYATVNGKTMNQIGTSDALGMLSNPEVQLARGFLKDFEQIAVQSNYRMSVYMSIPISGLSGLYAAVIGDGIKNAHLTTAATGSASSELDLNDTSNLSVNVVGGDKIATDNYGLAIDFWVRTNTDNNYLVLEGELETQETVVRATGTDGNGNTVDLYTGTVNSAEGSLEVDVYYRDGKWYLNGSNDEVSSFTTAPSPKEKTETTITGYHGANRVWDEDNLLISQDSTTQGLGSCYVFYADTPEEQIRFLHLLNAFRVAFVDDSGLLLKTAYLDTENAFSVNGKVTVPLIIKEATMMETVEIELDSNGNPVIDPETGEESTYTVKTPVVDENGDNVYGILPLTRNVPKLVTALVYLDGTLLGNEDVLSASSIEGQLNFQFGSSVGLHPIEDTELESMKRTITATIDKTVMDYTDADRTANVVVRVEGDTPANMSAFFQRAINNTQGKRMEKETFTKVGEGVWTAAFTFNAPGEYYMREVMLDGVSYPLAEPLHVSVSGFAPDSVVWSEGVNECTVYTAENTYSELLSLTFSPEESVRRSDSVYMVFMGDSGRTLRTKMTYNANRSIWEGTTVFGSSDTYRLRYVIVNDEYYDLETYNESFVKTITLYLGLYTEVRSSSSQIDNFQANTTYDKDMLVEIFDNVGNPLENLTDVVLTYSKGGSTTDTVSTPLTWNASRNGYEGVLPIIRSGNYTFLNVMIGNSRVTRATSAATFWLSNPDPVSYNTASVSDFHGEERVQFVPLTNDAYIGPIRINNSDTAYISAVVVNSVTGEEYAIQQSTDSSKRGVIYYEGNAWYINLPTYRPLQNDGTYGDYSQAGTWTVKSISLWAVNEQVGDTQVYHSSSNKLVWEDGQNGFDFSNLSTVVSCSINVSVYVNKTDVGDASSPFMTEHELGEETGLYVTILDDDGRAVTAAKISDVALNMTYGGNEDLGYGYKVSNKGAYSPYIKLNASNGQGTWTISEDRTVQYVGVYSAQNVKVTMSNGSTIVLNPGENGVPAQFTVTSQGPENNVKLRVSQGSTVLGKDAVGNVTGLFLGSQDPNVSITARIVYEDEDGNEKVAQYAVIDDFGINLSLNYASGKTAPNGGYSWTGTSPYENIELALTSGQATTNGTPYSSNSTTLLAGTYNLSASYHLNGSTYPVNHTFQPISVFSMSPTVKVTGVTPGNTTEVKIFQTDNYAEDYLWDEAKIETVRNFFSEYYANVYIQVNEGETVNEYDAPTLALTISNIGSKFQSASLTVPNASSSSNPSTFSFTSGSLTSRVKVGYVESTTVTLQEGGTCGSDDKLTYYTPHPVGTQTIGSISAVCDGITYNVNLEHSVTVRETNETPPSISFKRTTGYTMPSAQISEDGQSFTYILPTDVGTVSDLLVEPVGASEWEQTAQTTAKYVYQKSENKVTGSTGGCSPKTTYTYERTYAKYTRTTTTYTQTSGTVTYDVVYYVSGWTINGVRYALGAEVTVDGQIVVEPIISEQSRTLKDTATRTGAKTVILDVHDGDQTTSGTTSENETTAKNSYNLPSGYTWYNSGNKTDNSWLHTVEYSTEVWD